MIKTHIHSWGVVFCALLLAAASFSRADDLRATARATAQKLQKAVVTLRLVVKIRMHNQEQEQKIEVMGTVIDPSGLTVVSARAIDPGALMKSLFGAFPNAAGPQSFNFDSNVSETVLILDDGTEIESDVVLKDTDLDLAFVRPRNAARTFDAVPLKPRAAPPQILEDIFVLRRLGRAENREITIAQGTIQAVVKGPRTFYVCDAVAATDSFGCFAFASDGSPVGIFVIKDNRVMEPATGMGAMFPTMNMMGGGGSRALIAAVLRPVSDVLEIAAQAKEAKPPALKTPASSPVGNSSDAVKPSAPPPSSQPADKPSDKP
ncbi:MAG: hypothetical protein HY360_07230 [Verrucomicrobia bacterium]|nr:hypothetical protein [Verrucomicrobiota bacterium]